MESNLPCVIVMVEQDAEKNRFLVSFDFSFNIVFVQSPYFTAFSQQIVFLFRVFFSFTFYYFVVWQFFCFQCLLHLILVSYTKYTIIHRWNGRCNENATLKIENEQIKNYKRVQKQNRNRKKKISSCNHTHYTVSHTELKNFFRSRFLPLSFTLFEANKINRGETKNERNNTI